MARGKFQNKKRGTYQGAKGVNGWVGSPMGAASTTLSAPAGAAASTASRGVGRPAELPALGIAVMSPWGWRILAVFALVALGLCLTFFIDGKAVFGALWAVVTLAWCGFSVKLWHEHLRWDATATAGSAGGSERSRRPETAAS